MELTGPNVSLCEDVIDCILDCFDEKQSPDRAMLLTCSLVSRDWAYPSQVRILKIVVIHGPDLFHAFTSALPTVSAGVRAGIRELTIKGRMYPGPAGAMVISKAQHSLILNTFIHLESLSLVRVSLVIGEDPPHAIAPRHSLRYLRLEDVTNSAASWHPIHEIVAFASLFHNIDDFNVTVDFFHVKWRPLHRAVEDIRADTSWTATVSQTLTVSSLRIDGPPTTVLHILRFLRMLQAGHKLSAIRISVLDPEIVAEIEGILGQDPSVIQKLDLVFSSDMGTLLREERLVGFFLETMHHNSMTWTIDSSLLTNLNTLNVSYYMQTADELKSFSLRQWPQLLGFLEHFATLASPVKFIRLYIHIPFWDPFKVDAFNMLSGLSWDKLDVLLRRFGKLKRVLVRLDCNSPSTICGRGIAFHYLAHIAARLGNPKGKRYIAQFDWITDSGSEGKRSRYVLP